MTDPTTSPATDLGIDLEIEEVDPLDEDAVAAWLEVANAVDRHELGEHATPWALAEVLVDLRADSRHRRKQFFAGRVGGETVAAGLLALPLLDNLSAADVEIWVLPEHRRRGHGSRMLRRVEEAARAQGRTRFTAITAWPYDGGPDGAGTPGVEFARVEGYAFGLGEVQRELRLPADDAVLAELAAEAAPYHRDYEIRCWTGPVPDDLVQSWVELASTLVTEAPTGDNEHEPEAADVEAHRQQEAVLEQQGRVRWHSVATDATGRVVAYTDLVVPAHGQDCVFQWGTLVDPRHRGHRLGTAVKVANLQALQASGTAAGRRLVTWNAEVNDHMIGINERMGFRRAARSGVLQKKLA